MMKSVLSAAGFVAVASAFTQPLPNPSYGALLTPNGDNPIITGQKNLITWTPKTPTDGVTVSLVLCNGPSSNCVLQSSAIVEKVPASAASYSWDVPCSLPAGTASTASGYGMLIIVDGTGEFQYSTQFSVIPGSSCSSSGSSSSSSTSLPANGPTSSSFTSGWYSWSANNTTPVYTASTVYASIPVITTSTTGATATVTASTQATTTIATTSRSANPTPSPFAGAAAMPSAFVHAAGVIGAAGLAFLVL